MIDCRMHGIGRGISGFTGAIKEGEYLRVPGVPVGDTEEGDLLEPAHQLQADDLLVEALHHIQSSLRAAQSHLSP